MIEEMAVCGPTELDQTTTGRPGPATLPRRPHALGHGQPPRHLRLPAHRRQADLQGRGQDAPNYLFLGPKRGHLRRSNYADDFLTPAAEGLHPERKGLRRPVYTTAQPWPGLPIRRGNRRNKAADLADGTWPNLVGKFKPHDYRHSHATWLDAANLSKVIQMDRRGHALQGMDRVYMHVTRQMRERLYAALEELWQDALAEHYKISPHSHVPLLDDLLRAHETAQQTKITRTRRQSQSAKISDLATRSDTRRAQRSVS
jgi:hypothetical protein